MEVTLVKQDEVEFNLAEEKCEKVSHNIFRMLTGYQEQEQPDNDRPKMVVFKTKEEYQAEAYKYDFDLTKEVLINSKGNIFCYLASEAKPFKSQTKENKEIGNSTEENR